jgi:DNA-binding transcriptional ArsR family regulator
LIRFRLPVNAIEQVAVAYSPLFETVLSLKVLSQPRHHPLHHPWLREMRKLKPALRRQMDAYSFAYGKWVPIFLFARSTGGFDSFDDELERMRALPERTIRYEFSRFANQHAPPDPELLDDPNRRRAIVAAAEDVPADARVQLALALERPREFVDGFATFLRAYWRTAFRQEWQRIEPRLAAAVATAGEAIATEGVYPFLAGISPRVHVDPDRREVTVEKWYDSDREVEPDEAFVLAPSVYVWPHLLASCEGEWPPGLAYAAPFLSTDGSFLPPADLVRLLRALGDETRLRALRLLAEQPRSTQELAPLLGISEASLSKHLRLLNEIGLLSRKRSGHFVLYALLPERLAALQPSVRAFLDASSVSQ